MILPTANKTFLSGDCLSSLPLRTRRSVYARARLSRVLASSGESPAKVKKSSPRSGVVPGATGIGNLNQTFSFIPSKPVKDPRPSGGISGGVDEFYNLNPKPSSWRRKTKMVCTIGPATWDRETLFRLADEGMNVARLNMSHGDHKSHGAVIDLVREYNQLGRGHIALLLDTKGPEVRSGDLKEPLMLKLDDKYIFTISTPTQGACPMGGPFRIGVNYDGFVDDVSVGDTILVDGGIQTFKVLSKTKTDVEVKVVDGGEFKSRRHLNIRGKSANLPAITDRDWEDLRWGVERDVDYIALSFVRDAQCIYDLKAFIGENGARIGVLAKIESADSVRNLEEILDAVDGAMVARGDLGAELPVEQVPYWQSRIVQGCRKRGKPVIVATNMLESMIDNPTPTRAEVSDISIAVREGTDAVMLSGESAYGKFPYKAVDVMSTVASHTEVSMLSYIGSRRNGTPLSEKIDWVKPPQWRGCMEAGVSEVFAYHSTIMANTLKTSLVVFTRKGNMPALLSHYRPDNTIYAFTNSRKVQSLLALYQGVEALFMEFLPDADDTFNVAADILKERKLVTGGQLLAVVQSGRQPIWRSSSTHSIQVRPVPMDEDKYEASGSGDVDFLGPGSMLQRSIEMREYNQTMRTSTDGNALP